MQDNWYALVIAILFKQPPETAFQILEEGERNMNYSKLTELDTLDMIKFREEGITYREIGEMYGISESAAYKRIMYYKKHKKNRSTAMVAAT
jgi:DNA-directed RNA polymerase specialized sigma24 family protein